ncbi:hypothetical protein ACJMK2_030587 [Sinanodonta woodiana]|uniref:Mitochondria-eating protein C-terminal domain-containing protein n=1 Tax=Sinanodonta woodiana TaxID=1069815 RepID=A0ABD3WXJ1_SINWO
MACKQSPSSTEKDASNMKELISALRDIQSMDFDKLRANLSQSQPKGGNQCRCMEYKEVKARCDALELELNHYKNENEKLSTDKANIENEFARVKDEVRRKEQACLEHIREISRLQGKVNAIENNLKALEEQMKNYQYPLNRKEEKWQTQNEATMTAEADQNGLAKLGERYRELYDSEWLNAFDLITSSFHHDDRTAIEFLRRILVECYRLVIEMSEKQLTKAEHALTGSSKRADSNCRRLLKEARTLVDIKQADDLLKNFLEAYFVKVIPETYLTEPVIQMFAAKCFQLCWLMSVQDPPAAFAELPAQGDEFDTNMYRYYTITGDKIDIVVLPALLLRENGPLVDKGIAQSYPKTSALPALRGGNSATKEKDVLERTRQSRDQNHGTVITYGSDTTKHGHHVQVDAASLSEPHQYPMMTQMEGGNYGVFPPMPNAPAERCTFQPTHQYLTQGPDWENFQYFCQCIQMYDEASVRNIFGLYFDRYNYFYKYGSGQAAGYAPN